MGVSKLPPLRKRPDTNGATPEVAVQAIVEQHALKGLEHLVRCLLRVRASHRSRQGQSAAARCRRSGPYSASSRGTRSMAGGARHRRSVISERWERPCRHAIVALADAQVRAGLYTRDAQGKRAIRRSSASYVTNVFFTHAVRDPQKIFGF